MVALNDVKGFEIDGRLGCSAILEERSKLFIDGITLVCVRYLKRVDTEKCP